MRVVIEDIKGKELVLLMKILERLEFGNKDELLIKYYDWLDKQGIKHD
jgi:hypothetical protein